MMAPFIVRLDRDNFACFNGCRVLEEYIFQGTLSSGVYSAEFRGLCREEGTQC